MKTHNPRPLGLTLYEVRGTFEAWRVRKVLDAAKVAGVVVEYGTGDGLVWLKGYHGAQLREVRAQVRRLVEETT